MLVVFQWWGFFSSLYESFWVFIPANSYVCSSQYGGCGEFIGVFCYNLASVFISGTLYRCFKTWRAHMASETTSAEVY